MAGYRVTINVFEKNNPTKSIEDLLQEIKNAGFGKLQSVEKFEN